MARRTSFIKLKGFLWPRGFKFSLLARTDAIFHSLSTVCVGRSSSNSLSLGVDIPNASAWQGGGQRTDMLADEDFFTFSIIMVVNANVDETSSYEFWKKPFDRVRL